MKGGIAAWVAAVSEVLAEGDVPGSLSFLITGDEEGPALHGTKRVVETLLDLGAARAQRGRGLVVHGMYTALKSLTLVRVGPVLTKSPILSKRL